VSDLVERLRTAEKEIARIRVESLLARTGELAASATDVYGVQFVGAVAEGAGGGDARTLALDVRGRMGAERPAVVAVVGTGDGKPSVVVALNDAAQQWGLNAGELVRVAAQALGGKGGGKADLAQGGGVDATAAPDALRDVELTVGRRVTGG
jgi:alanyl-tRNA synthetase